MEIVNWSFSLWHVYLVDSLYAIETVLMAIPNVYIYIPIGIYRILPSRYMSPLHFYLYILYFIIYFVYPVDSMSAVWYTLTHAHICIAYCIFVRGCNVDRLRYACELNFIYIFFFPFESSSSYASGSSSLDFLMAWGLWSMLVSLSSGVIAPKGEEMQRHIMPVGRQGDTLICI